MQYNRKMFIQQINYRKINKINFYLFIYFIIILLGICAASPVFNNKNSYISQIQTGRNIRHLPCIVRRSGLEGVCMFAIDCLKSNGTHLGTCIDRFYFGSCCQLRDENYLLGQEIIDNSIDQNTISHFPFVPSSIASSEKPLLTVTTASVSSTQKFPSPPPPMGPSFHYELVSSSSTNRPRINTTIEDMNAALTTTLSIVNSQFMSALADELPTSPEAGTPTTENIKLQTFQSIQEDLTTTEVITTAVPIVISTKPTTSTTQKPKPTRTTTTRPTFTSRPRPKPTNSTTTRKPTVTVIKRPTNSTTSRPINDNIPIRPKPTRRPVQNVTQKITTKRPVRPNLSEKPIETTSTTITKKPITTRRPIVIIEEQVTKGKPAFTRRPTTAAPITTTEEQFTTLSFVQITKAPRPKPKPTSQVAIVPPTSLDHLIGQDEIVETTAAPAINTTKVPITTAKPTTIKTTQSTSAPVTRPSTTTVKITTKAPSTTASTTPTTTTTITTTVKPSSTTQTPSTTIKSTIVTKQPVVTPTKTPTSSPSPTTATLEELQTEIVPNIVEPPSKPIPSILIASSTPNKTLSTTIAPEDEFTTQKSDGLVTWSNYNENTTNEEETSWKPNDPSDWVLIPNIQEATTMFNKPEIEINTEYVPMIEVTKKEENDNNNDDKITTASPITTSSKIPVSLGTSITTESNEIPLIEVITERLPEKNKTTIISETTATTTASDVETSTAIATTTTITVKPSSNITSTTTLEPLINITIIEQESTEIPLFSTITTSEKPMIMVNLTTAEEDTTIIITESPFVNMNNVTLIELPLIPNNNNNNNNNNNENITMEELTTILPLDNVTLIHTPYDNVTDNLFTTTTAYPTFDGVDYQQICGKRMFPQPRIVGGTKAAFGRWPWQISLRQWRTSTYLHKCGAALLNENWAITAAHCVDNVPPSDLLLRLGEYDLAEEEEPFGYQERRVQIVASHPQFDPRTFEYDLALLRFYEPIAFQPNIIPVCVPETDENFVGRTAFVTGWGRLYEDGPLPSVLQEVSVPVINNTICETMYRSAGYIEHIPHIFICAGWRKGGYDSCEGDSGGPMVIQRDDKRFQLAGVISWGIGCAEPNQPGVYTRISEFRDWINQILQF